MKKITVKKVHDGDTFKGSRDQFYRLAEVYAPERGQRGYKKAKEIKSTII
jgi:endonuclease YncB( thermonuclease family)